MIFHERPLWLRLAFALSAIGFVVWVSASDVFLLDPQLENVKTAFLIIGLLTYYTGLGVTFACTFLDIFDGNSIVLLIDAACMVLAGVSGLIAASVARITTFSDRLGWALVCALISGAFLILTVFSGGRGSGSRDANSANNHSQQQQQQQRQQQQPASTGAAPDWNSDGGYYGPQQ